MLKLVMLGAAMEEIDNMGNEMFDHLKGKQGSAWGSRQIYNEGTLALTGQTT